MNVAMSCGGCANSVRNVLKNNDGISNLDINVEAKTVVVEGSFDKAMILEKVKKTGLATEEVSFEE
jgi:copper chaperone CopZ